MKMYEMRDDRGARTIIAAKSMEAARAEAWAWLTSKDADRVRVNVYELDKNGAVRPIRR